MHLLAIALLNLCNWRKKIANTVCTVAVEDSGVAVRTMAAKAQFQMAHRQHHQQDPRRPIYPPPTSLQEYLLFQTLHPYLRLFPWTSQQVVFRVLMLSRSTTFLAQNRCGWIIIMPNILSKVTLWHYQPAQRQSSKENGLLIKVDDSWTRLSWHTLTYIQLSNIIAIFGILSVLFTIRMKRESQFATRPPAQRCLLASKSQNTPFWIIRV